LLKRRPKLGQHFLTDPGYQHRILQALSLKPSDLVIEIGPGRGAMTRLLAQRARELVAIELDRALAERLRDEFASEKSIEIIHGDILQTDLGEICGRHRVDRAFVFGNLPYYITSPILRHLFLYRSCVRAMALLVQHEVAERITAGPGTRDSGFLSVLVQLDSESRIALEIPPGAFSPPPQVRSALVAFKMLPKFPPWSADQHDRFLSFAKRCFAQKRKNLVNNLAGVASRHEVEQALKNAGLPRTVRAEQLTLAQLAALLDALRPATRERPERTFA
jgi:16S rRNA (adenine1518-N6/adenine1519-N6)-dimethyltransferase